MQITYAPSIPLEERDAFLKSPKVVRAISNAEACGATRMKVNAIHMFGSKLGMADVEFTDAKRADGGPAPGIMFIRGDAVAVLPIFKAEDGELYTAVTRQTRLAVGSQTFAEIPAGMMDDEGNFKSKALEELSEELGADIKVSEDQLVFLESVYPSPGGCDERIDVFYFEMDAPPHLLESLNGRETGMGGEHESISVEVIPLSALRETAPTDMKAVVSLYAYAAKTGYDLSRRPPETSAAPAPKA